MSVLPGVSRAMWLRTGYVSERNAAYEELFKIVIAKENVEKDAVLDEGTLYAFESNWNHILQPFSLVHRH
jgi:hypothetical protein